MTYSSTSHRDEPDCDCGGCEPAESVNNPLAMMLTGNQACDFPACITVGARCSWGDGYCSPAVRQAIGDYTDASSTA